MLAVLEQSVIEWVKIKSENAITQHSQKWLDAKTSTIGGSSLAAIQGKNPYSTIDDVIKEKIGLKKYESKTAAQWGNLFEEIIKKKVEHDYCTTVHGENLYVEGAPGTAYSPDGVAVIKRDGRPVVSLMEFKCPYTRMPGLNVPEYYIPQVKMGLDLLNFPTVGLFAEAVFRRCSWECLNTGKLFDKGLGQRVYGGQPNTLGFVGFYYSDEKFIKKITKMDQSNAARITAQKVELLKNYDEHYGVVGNLSNGYENNDLGDSPKELFAQLMSAYDGGIVRLWYSELVFADKNDDFNDNFAPEIDEKMSDDAVNAALDANLQKYSTFFATMPPQTINLGILPWKLFGIYYNFIEPTANYLQSWMPIIGEILEVVKKCNEAPDHAAKLKIYLNYISG